MIFFGKSYRGHKTQQAPLPLLLYGQTGQNVVSVVLQIVVV